MVSDVTPSNRRVLLVALVLLWFLEVGYLLAGYLAFAAFDGYEVHLVEVSALYGGMGLAVAGAIYVGITWLLDRRR